MPQPLSQAAAVPGGCPQPSAAPSAVPAVLSASLARPGRVDLACGCRILMGAAGFAQLGESQAALGSTRAAACCLPGRQGWWRAAGMVLPEPGCPGLPSAGRAFPSVSSRFFGGRLSTLSRLERGLLLLPLGSHVSWGIARAVGRSHQHCFTHPAPRAAASRRAPSRELQGMGNTRCSVAAMLAGILGWQHHSPRQESVRHI